MYLNLFHGSSKSSFSAVCCTVYDVEAADGDLEVYVEEDDVEKEKNRITNTPLPELFLTGHTLLLVCCSLIVN